MSIAAGHTEIQQYKGPDNTPKSHFNIAVSQRDLNEINHLVSRQFAGMSCGWLPTALAVTNVLKQINDQNIEDLDNYDTEGTCPKCQAPEHDDTD